MTFSSRQLRFYGTDDLDVLPQLRRLSSRERFAMEVVSKVLPFRTNNYVIEELIDWEKVPDDPIYQLSFMQEGMLQPEHYDRMARLVRRKAPPADVRALANSIRMQLKPHPDGQATDNVPVMDGEALPGVQHKYRETCLIFPSSGQTCHSYCTYCFRWPQFVGIPSLKFATDERNRFRDYIKEHKEITDVLVTGGDPLVMSAKKLALYIEPLLSPEFDHVQTVRVGTKSVAFWPYRFVTDADADDLLRLFEKVVKSGKHLALMCHFSHPKEMATPVARAAIRRIRDAGAVIRTQSPIMRHVNDSPRDWILMWEEQVRLGCIPYYMFAGRETGAESYFAVSLYRASRIFSEAYKQTSGICRTVRGPCMSAHPGKVVVEGVAVVQGEEVFVLSFVQARNPDWCRRPFFARFDPAATWLDQLRPASGEREFFYEAELRRMGGPLRWQEPPAQAASALLESS